MAADSSQIIIPGNATLWLGPVGTVAPTDATTTPGSGWVDAGFTTPDGSSFATSPQFADVFAHQSFTPVRTYKTEDSAQLQVVMEQWNTVNFEAAFGGGTVAVTSLIPKFTPPFGTTSTPTAVLFDFVDGSSSFRLVIPKARARAGVTLNLSRTSPSNLPLTLAVEATSNTVAPFYMYAPASSTAFTAG